jgi:hypothetical protein
MPLVKRKTPFFLKGGALPTCLRPNGWSRDRGCGAVQIFEEMRRAVEAAAPDRLGEVASAVWQAYGAGGLTDDEAEQLDGLLNARRGAARAAPVKAQPLALVAAQLAPVAASAPREAALAAPAHHRTGSRPRTAESAARRRRWAAAGYLPPALAQAFTAGEQAVLAVIALEVGKRGSCSLAIGQIAALAGVCATLVKRALRQAKLLGLITVEERRLSRWRSDTNVVRVVSREWAAWLRLRLPRSNHSGLRGDGGTPVHSTWIGSGKQACSAPFRRRDWRGAGPLRASGTGQSTASA